MILSSAKAIMENSLKVKGPFTMELLSGGFSGSEIIKVSTPNQSYVIRYWNMRQWKEDFPQDLACQLIASQAGYGPKVYFSDEAQGITVMEYLFPETLPEFRMRLKAMVDLLRKIHTGPRVPQGIDRATYLDFLIDETKETQLFDPNTIRIIKDTIFGCTRPHASSVACHRDLHHGNLLYSQGGFLAIDYTWGAMDDPYTDLANISIFNCETLEDNLLLLQLYLERSPCPAETARLSLMKLPIKIFYGLEFLGISRKSPRTSQVASKSYKGFGHQKDTPHDLLHYGQTLLSEVVEYSQSKEYIQNLDQILTRR